MNAVTFAAVLPALLVAHNVGDHWVQTSRQAARNALDQSWHHGWLLVAALATALL